MATTTTDAPAAAAGFRSAGDGPQHADDEDSLVSTGSIVPSERPHEGHRAHDGHGTDAAAANYGGSVAAVLGGCRFPAGWSCRVR